MRLALFASISWRSTALQSPTMPTLTLRGAVAISSARLSAPWSLRVLHGGVEGRGRLIDLRSRRPGPASAHQNVNFVLLDQPVLLDFSPYLAVDGRGLASPLSSPCHQTRDIGVRKKLTANDSQPWGRLGTS